MFEGLSDTQLHSETVRYYHERADDFIRLRGELYAPWLPTVVASLLSSVADGALLLDVGCGSGRLIPMLSRAGVTRYIGVDASEGLIAVARTSHPSQEFRVGTVQTLPHVVSERCDLFFAYESLQHVPRGQMLESLRSLRSVLRDGGSGYINVPFGDAEKLLTNETMIEVPSGYRVYTTAWLPDTLFPLVAEAGFTIFDIDEEDPQALAFYVTTA